jgi:hypothetical protein
MPVLRLTDKAIGHSQIDPYNSLTSCYQQSGGTGAYCISVSSGPIDNNTANLLNFASVTPYTIFDDLRLDGPESCGINAQIAPTQIKECNSSDFGPFLYSQATNSSRNFYKVTADASICKDTVSGQYPTSENITTCFWNQANAAEDKALALYKKPIPHRGLLNNEIVAISLGALGGVILLALIAYLMHNRYCAQKKPSSRKPMDGNHYEEVPDS